MSLILHYDVLNEFKRQFYKDVLGFEHLQEGEIKIDKVSFPDGGSDEEFNFWGYQFEKNGIKYLMPSKTIDGIDIKLNELLPILPKDTQKIAYRGNVYYLINKPISVRFRPEKSMSFKEMINILNDLKHSNPEHRKLLLFMGIASLFDRTNFRLATPASFGKDSVVDILGNLFGSCFTIENPTIAKLEYMTYAKWLAVNEIVDIAKPEWRNIEQFLLSAGAHKPEITKHSRAMANGTKEILDITKFSLALMYNDIDHYPESDKYVDYVTKKAVLDRFPAFRLQGVLQEDFNQVKNIDVKKFVVENFDTFRKLIYTFTYYKENLMKELRRYNADKLRQDIPHRWLINIGRVLKVIDLYCDTQEEFDKWIQIINNSINDYTEMLRYPDLISNCSKKLGSNDYNTLRKELRLKDSFVDKNLLMNNLLKGQKGITKTFWG